ncbi:hypothetical protein ECP030230813_5101, partial [Escherichia coli P0302308.13]
MVLPSPPHLKNYHKSAIMYLLIAKGRGTIFMKFIFL